VYVFGFRQRNPWIFQRLDGFYVTFWATSWATWRLTRAMRLDCDVPGCQQVSQANPRQLKRHLGAAAAICIWVRRTYLPLFSST
jgi:hypothetical protein